MTSEFPFLSEIGLGLTGFGIFFSFLGIIFFFDKGLIAKGSVWSRDVPDIKGDGIPPANWEWTCTAIDEKSVTLNLKFLERDCPDAINAAGTIVVDKASGWPESIDVTLHNTKIPYDSENIVVDLHVVWHKS